MSEEISGTPTEHVSLGENGVIMLSPEAQAVMEQVEMPDVPDVHIEEPQENPPVSETPQEAQARKIKWNGQEVEVKPEQEIELLQKGYNYEQKMAQLEQDRARIQAYNGLVSAIESSPAIKAKVAEALGYGAQAPVNEQPTFDDPIEQLKWETRQEVLKEVEEKFVKPMQQQNQLNAHQQQLQAVRQSVQQDPMFQQVQTAIIEQIKTLPESIGKGLYQQLDQNPQAYIDMYRSVRERIAAQPQPTQQVAEAPQPTKRETKAPILESGNNPVSESAESQKMQERIKELTRKSKAGDYQATGELMSLLA